MLRYKGKNISQTLQELVDPKHSALVIHDMLNDFVTPGGIGVEGTGASVNVDAILPPIMKLVEVARSKRVRIVYVRFTQYNDYRTWHEPMISRSHKQMIDHSVRLPAIEGTWGHEFSQELTPKEGDIIVNKFRTDSFFQTNLDLVLRYNGVRTFIIIGVGTEVGIVPTIIHGMNLGYFPVVPDDCILLSDPRWLADTMVMLEDWSVMPNSTEIIKAWSS